MNVLTIVSVFTLSLCWVSITNAGTCPKYPLIRDFDFKKVSRGN